MGRGTVPAGEELIKTGMCKGGFTCRIGRWYREEYNSLYGKMKGQRSLQKCGKA